MPSGGGGGALLDLRRRVPCILATSLAQTYNETVKADPIFCIHQSIYDGITALKLESRGNVISCSVESKFPSP